jgi:protein Mpv17
VQIPLALWVTIIILNLIFQYKTLAFQSPATHQHHRNRPSPPITPQHHHHHQQQATIKQSASTTRKTTKLKMSLQEVSDFYQNYPLQSAILTCGVKASIADSLAQFRDHVASSASRMGEPMTRSIKQDGANGFNWELRRNLAYVMYGGIFVGFMCHLEYNIIFPQLFGTDQSLLTVFKKVIFDDFVSAPLVWLPPAYFIKAWVYDYSMNEGLRKYWRDVQENDLLAKYWTVWVPAQSISFSVIPGHLRVAFMASVSFFWFILFSSVSHDETSNIEDDNESSSAITATTSIQTAQTSTI